MLKHSKKQQKNKMKCIIRIRGRVGLNRDIIETFNRLNLRKKYNCIVIDPTKVQEGMIRKLRNFVAFGDISEEMYKKLKGKKDQRFFRLHPPLGGIRTKVHFPKGVLGDHKEKINELLERML